MKFKRIFFLIGIFILIYCYTILISSCAQIGAISGGTKDTLPPVLVNANPNILTTNFSGNKITLTFDEYVDAQDVQSNLLVSPLPKNSPIINAKLKTVSIKLKDSLLPNTTYSINFGNAIKDVNEGNILKNFTYVFSTGNYIDSLNYSGKVLLAESAKPDSTLIVMLYENATDSAVKKIKPNYIAKVDGKGNFKFNNLPSGVYNIYALKDENGGKTYYSKSQLFAFNDKPINVADTGTQIILYAYAEEKEFKTASTSTSAKSKTLSQKKLKYSVKASSEKQDIRNNLSIDFNSKLKSFNADKFILTDTNFKKIAAAISFSKDSSQLLLKTNWLQDADYKLVILKNAVLDILDSANVKNDTLNFKTKNESDYGNVTFRFNNINLTKHPVLQFVQDDQVKESFAITNKEWNYKLFPPGDYEIRILYDDNNNGKWDAGNYQKKLQPEKVIALPKKFTVKENWDNENEINL